jgi:hypothetical protein
MNITIWTHKSEAISGKIKDYYYTRPYFDRSEEWVEVQLTQDEFAILEDKPSTIEVDTDLSILLEKYSTIKGGDFPAFWEGLNKTEQIKLADYYEWK